MLPEPYYDRDGITIYCGEALDILPSLGIDSSAVIVSDPPYGTGGWRRPESGRGDDPTASLVVEAWDDGAVGWLEWCASAAAVLTFWPPARTSRLLESAESHGLTKHRAVYLRKPDPKPMVGGRISWSVEPVWVLSRDGYVLYGKSDWHEASVPRANRDTDATGHPYQKPTSAMLWLVSMTREPVVIDPYMGSGTTLLAAKTLGRSAIGIEREERWCAVAVRRLQQAVLPMEMTA
jgi:site-specific DNA-methyltransferase (adenine-specific)